MKILTKYLGSTVVNYILLVMLLLLGVQTFIEFTKEFPNIGTGSYVLSKVLIYVPMMLPSGIYQFFPVAGLLGCIIGLGLLSSHSELIIMRTSGISLFEITLAVTKSSIILIVITLLIGEVLAPISQRAAHRYKTTAMSSGQALSTQQGTWVRSGNNFVHISTIANKKEIKGIIRYEFADNRKLKTARTAENGIYKDGKWTFYNVTQTTFANDDTLDSASFPEQQWDINLNPNIIGSSIDTDQKSLVQLYSYVKGRKQSGLNAAIYDFIFWNRIFAPFSNLIMILLAIPFVFGPLRKSSMGLRMVVGIICGVGCYMINQFIGPISIVYNINPILAAILPSIIFGCIGSTILLKMK
jgi:lipopolysaccharide export system permease protein